MGPGSFINKSTAESNTVKKAEIYCVSVGEEWCMVGNRLAPSPVLGDGPRRRDEKRGSNKDVIWERENEGEEGLTDWSGRKKGRAAWWREEWRKKKEREDGVTEGREEAGESRGGQKDGEWQNEETEEGRVAEGGRVWQIPPSLALCRGVNEASAAFLLRANLNNEAV